MNIAENLNRIQEAKENIKTAIQAKGVAVSDDAKIDEYPLLINQISGGGGEDNLEKLLKNQLTEYNVPYGVTTIPANLFNSYSTLKKVTFPNTLTNIGANAFQFNELSSITIPDSVTSLGVAAFAGKPTTPYGASELTIGSGITSIPNNCFTYLTATEVEIPSNVKSIGQQAFIGCPYLTSVTFNEGLETISNEAFRNCHLRSVNFPSTVKNIGASAFTNQNITELVIPSGVTSLYLIAPYNPITSVTLNEGLQRIEDYGLAYSQLNSIDIPSSVTYVGSYAFSGCTNIKEITIPEGVTYIGSYAFAKCTSLTSLTIPSSVTSIGSYAFSGCTNLQNLTLNAKVQVTSAMTGTLRNLRTLTIGGEGSSIDGQAFSGATSLTSVTLNEGITTIGDRAFSSCKMSTVTIPDSVTSIGTAAFEKNNNLTKVIVGSGMTSFGLIAFNECKYIKEMYFRGMNAPSGTTNPSSNPFGYIRKSTYSGTSYNTYAGVSATTPTYYYPIGGTNYLTSSYPYSYLYEAQTPKTSTMSFYVSSTSAVTAMGYGWAAKTWKPQGYGENEYALLTYTDGATEQVPFDKDGNDILSGNTRIKEVSFGSDVQKIGSYCFRQCSNLEKVTLPSTMTSIPAYAFNGCTKLTDVNLDNITSYGSYCFYGCNSLTSVTISNRVTSVGSYAYQSCSNLTSVIWNTNYNYIQNGLFAGCTKLQVIDFSGGATQVVNFVASLNRPTTGTDSYLPTTVQYIVVPDNLYDEWKASTYWSNYTDKIISKSDYDAL